MILNLFKIFILLTFLGCVSNIIIAFYEATLSSKKNTKYETYAIVPFIFGLFICVYLKNVFLFAFLLLLKELFLIFVRTFSVKDYIINFNYLIIIITTFTLAFITSIFNFELSSYVFSLIFLTILIFNFPYGLILKEFFNTKRFNFK